MRGIAAVALKPLFKQRLEWRLAGPGSFAQEISWHPRLTNVLGLFHGLRQAACPHCSIPMLGFPAIKQC